MSLYEQEILTKEEYERKINYIKESQESKKRANSQEFLELKKKVGSDNIVRFAEKGDNNWICVCGVENDLSRGNCKGCSLNQQYVLENCTRGS